MNRHWVFLVCAALALLLCQRLPLSAAEETPSADDAPPPAIINASWAENDRTAIPSDPDYGTLYNHVPRDEFPALRDHLNPFAQKKTPFVFEDIDYPTGENSPTSYRFDMGPQDSPLHEGYTRVTREDVFSWEKGWGWESPPAADFAYTGPDSVSVQKRVDFELVQLERMESAFSRRGKEFRATGPRRFYYTDPMCRAFLDELSSDAVLNPGELVFKVALPNGRYSVSMIVGDVQLPRYGMDVYANGYLVASDLYTKGMPFPVRVAFSTNVVRNNLRIALRANDAPFVERSEVAAETPDYNYSQLPFVLAFAEKKSSPFFGKQMNQHGPATQMAVAGISITPFEQPPLELVRQRLFPDPSVTDPNALQGVELFNSGDLAGAEERFGRIPDSEASLKAHAYLALAGHLETEIEEEINFVDTAIGLLDRGCRAQPDNVRAEDLLRLLRVYRGGLAYFADQFKPSMKVTGLPREAPKPQDSQAFSARRRKNSALFTWVCPNDILYPKALLRYARYLASGDPHRWTAAWQAAEEALIALQDLVPGNRFSRYYLYWDTDGWDIKDYSGDTEGAPKWAVLMREAYGRMLDQAAWWGENRLQADGSIGGGWGDDVEIAQAWLILTLINPDANPKATEVARAIADGVWWSGEIDRDAGFYDGIADVEHTAEWTGDTQPYLLAIDYGNPHYFERNLKTAKLMRDLWMGRTPRGHLHFKSMVLGNKAIGTSYGGVLDAEIDCPLNGRATGPAFWDWWYSPLDELDRIFGDWAEAWYEDSMRAENGKPEGIIPGPIGFHTDVLGGNNATVWRQGAPQVNGYENPRYTEYIRSLFARMYSRTGDEKWLQPKAVKLTAKEVIMDEFEYVPNIGEGTKIDDKYVGLEEADLDHLLAVIRKTWPSLTSENSNTDRIAPPGILPIIGLVTGGQVQFGLDFIPMTLRKTSSNVAFMNLASSQEYAKTIFYNFRETPEPVFLNLWKLKVGSEHEVTVGIDDNDDDEIDTVLEVIPYRHLHRGDSVEFEIPPRKACVVEVKQTKPGEGMPERVVDLALAPEDIKYEDGKLLITVHNIGNMNCGPFTFNVRQGRAKTGKLLASFNIDGLEAPNDLEPRTVTRSIEWQLPADATLEKPVTITVEIDPGDDHYEITELNNVKSRPFPHEKKTYLTPRMWKTLAEQYGRNRWDPFPEDFPKDQIR